MHDLRMANGRKYNDTIVDEKNNQLEVVNEADLESVLDIYGQENPYSVINTVPPVIKEQIELIPQELREMTTEELRILLAPNKTLNQLRLRFWKEYDRVLGLRVKRHMSIPKIIAGVCSMPVFRRIIANRENAAWILTPVSSYALGIEELMETTLSKLRDSLDNVQAMESKDLSVLLKIFETFDKRIHGDYKKTVEIKGTAESVESTVAKKTSEELSHIKNDLLIGD